jgi:death on curing protein
MDEPTWILDVAVRAIHSRQLAEHGGLDGISDVGLLSSALAPPKNVFAYSSPKPDIETLAAAYGCGIIRNYPFVDGNKRTAYVICRTFLLLNGYNIEATHEEKYEVFIGVAGGSLSDEALAIWIRSHLIIAIEDP